MARLASDLQEDAGPDEGKVFDLVRGLQKEIDDDPGAAAVLQPLKDRAERTLEDMEHRKVTGLAALDLLAALAAEKEAAAQAAAESELSTRAFGVYWLLKDERPLTTAGIDPKAITREVESLAARFPNAAVNPDELRRFRAQLYRPLLALGNDEPTSLVDKVMSTLFS